MNNTAPPPLPRRRGRIASFLDGFAAPWAGLRYMNAHPALWRHGVLPILCNLVLTAALFAGLVYGWFKAYAWVDAAFPATERLEVALLNWNPASAAADSLADEVERSFAEAREQAEALGFDHLPETARGTARRAHTLARTALAAGTPAERVAA